MNRYGSLLLPLLIAAVAACGSLKKGKTAASKADTAALRELYYAAETQFILGNYKSADSMFSRYVRGGFRTAPGYYRLAALAHKRSQQARAMEFLKKALEADTGIREFHILEAAIYTENRQYSQAADAFAALAARSPRAWTLYADAARFYQYAGKYSSMLEICQKWEASFGLLEAIAENKSNAYRGLGNMKAAAAEWDRLAKKYPERRQYRLKYADMLRLAGETDRSRNVYDSLLAENPGDAAVISQLCRHFSAGRPQDQFRWASQLAGSTQASFQSKMDCMQSLLTPKSGYYDSMQPLLLKLVEIHPTESLTHTQLGDWLQQHGRSAAAAVAYRKSLNMLGADMQTWKKYLDALSQSCDLKAFSNQADTLAELYPNQSSAAQYQGLAALYTGAYEEGIANLEAALLFAADDEQRRTLQLLMARIWNRQGKQAEALKVCTNILSQYPENAGAAHAAAEVYLSRSEFAEAARYIGIALRADAANPWYRLTQFQISLAAGETPAETGLPLNYLPESPFALEAAGDFRQKSGNCNAASELWKKAIVCAGFGRKTPVEDKIKSCLNR